MFHRHLNHHWYTLAAIDDVICGEPLETCVAGALRRATQRHNLSMNF